LHVVPVQLSLLEFLIRIEGMLYDSAGPNILVLGTDKGRTLAGLNVLKLDDLKHLAVHFKG
jgi:hypothetical protein